MPFVRYGVLSGTLHRHHRDRPDSQGRWFHVNLEVDAPAGRHHCAVDVDSHASAVGVRWKTFTLPAEALGPAAALAASPGYHELPRTPDSGALDYVRHPELADRSGILFTRRPPSWLQDLLELVDSRPWHAGSNVDAALALESILVPGQHVLVFGEPFDDDPDGDLGMHNVHQNQGDPAGSQWWVENGTWQDGATLTRRPDGAYDLFLNKFSSQSDRTDAAGHPVA
ncbi:DUF2278 family protein [Streptomyces sp. UH6]|uniref:DUF2278 family protein n=1 Tax=Streptomyces sp. UH6 TaxID=2748379 RepID=UPI0015D4D264|nr:DUF2278 family protein [Streptomyces sp. UH6]NYV77896.1 DUF2278 family protein [Streptomyces sp. UH6]